MQKLAVKQRTPKTKACWWRSRPG